MKIEVDKKFVKDTMKLSSEVQKRIISVLDEISLAENLNDFDVKK